MAVLNMMLVDCRRLRLACGVVVCNPQLLRMMNPDYAAIESMLSQADCRWRFRKG